MGLRERFAQHMRLDGVAVSTNNNKASEDAAPAERADMQSDMQSDMNSYQSNMNNKNERADMQYNRTHDNINTNDKINKMEHNNDAVMAGALHNDHRSAGGNSAVNNKYAVDAMTARRCGNFAAYGLADGAILRALMITPEQLAWARDSAPYQEAFMQQSTERVQRAIDLEDGWDTAETQALHQVLEALEYTHDPRYALQVAVCANKAQRRTPGQNARVIDAAKGQTVITLTMNKSYVNNVQQNTNGAVTIPPQRDLSRRLHDVPTPKDVTKLLNVKSTSATFNSEVDRYVEKLKSMGISPDMIKSQGSTEDHDNERGDFAIS